MIPDQLRTVTATRYIIPLREGGSLPALVEADDDFKYVLKFRGAGHGVKALISEFLGGQIAKALGLPVPELVYVNLHEAFGKTEADEEIQDLLVFSKGLNLGLHYLNGAFTFESAVNECDALLASKIVWLDAFITNVDRTFRNTNLLIWHKEIWLIDHGAAFYFHHSWDNWEQSAQTAFPFIKDHVLLPFATELDQVHKDFTTILTPEILKEIVEQLPLEWLDWEGSGLTPEDIKNVYAQFLCIRLQHANNFLEQAKNAR